MSGVSLIEAVIAIFIVGVLVVAFMRMGGINTKASQSVEVRGEIIDARLRTARTMNCDRTVQAALSSCASASPGHPTHAAILDRQDNELIASGSNGTKFEKVQMRALCHSLGDTFAFHLQAKEVGRADGKYKDWTTVNPNIPLVCSAMQTCNVNLSMYIMPWVSWFEHNSGTPECSGRVTTVFPPEARNFNLTTALGHIDDANARVSLDGTQILGCPTYEGPATHQHGHALSTDVSAQFEAGAREFTGRVRSWHTTNCAVRIGVTGTYRALTCAHTWSRTCLQWGLGCY